MAWRVGKHASTQIQTDNRTAESMGVQSERKTQQDTNTNFEKINLNPLN